MHDAQNNQYKFSTNIFFVILIIYGLFSSSTPDQITPIEILIGIFLLIFVGTEGIKELLQSKIDHTTDQEIIIPNIIKISFWYLVFIPSFLGLIVYENSLKNWLRDIIPLFYLFLPLLLIKKINKIPKKLFLISIMGLSIVGLLFSIKFYVGATGGFGDIGSGQIIGTNRDNTMQDPAVQLTLSLGTCLSIWLLLKGKLVQGLSIASISLIPWTVMFAAIVRGPVFFTFLSIIILIIYWFIINNKRLRALFFLFLVGLLIINFGQNIVDIIKNSINLLIEKQLEHGLNSRDIELQVVIGSLNKNIFSFFFGNGWGSLIEIPNIAIIRNMHNIFFYFLYKSGFVGFVCVGLFFLWITKFIFLIAFRSIFFTLVLIALINPFIYGSMFQPMYKSLSFGVIMILFPLMNNLYKKDEFSKWL